MTLYADKRKSKRLPFRHTVKYGQIHPPSRVSFVTDLSEGGIYIKTITVFLPRTKVYMAISVERVNYEVEGIVTWAKKVPPQIIHQVKGGMGIRFTSTNKELLEVYNNKLQVTAYAEPL